MVCGAENESRIKLLTEIGNFIVIYHYGLVGERLKCSEVGAVRPGGALGSENAGMSSVMQMRYLHTENPRFPPQCKSSEGKSALRVFLVKGD